MKYTLLVLAFTLLFAPAIAHAIVWTDGTSFTVEWDAVPPVSPTDTITYIVYLKDVINNAIVSESAEISTTSYSITISDQIDGLYNVGVQAVRHTDFGMTKTSTISWSDDPAVVATDPFGLRYVVVPEDVVGLSAVVLE